MKQKYKSEKSIRIMEISRELEELISKAKDNPIAQRIYQLSGEIAIMAVADADDHNDLLNKHLELLEKYILSTGIVMEYLNGIGYQDDFREFAKEFMDDSKSLIN